MDAQTDLISPWSESWKTINLGNIILAFLSPLLAPQG
jgi:hypothetical protein